jgi:4-amino-4-deoxy-L-arabinose transferase-like glycosyltransferase
MSAHGNTDLELAQRELRRQQRWLGFGYVFIAVLVVFRLGYIASGVIELTKDEAYQWLWSKHLALSYYSKPPGIALIQFAGTSLWGDTEFGVRFFSPVFAAILSLVMLRFMAREVGARQAVVLLLIVTAAPLMCIGTILMTIDPPLVLCWTLAMLAGWRAMQPDGTTRHWLLAGAAAGLAFLSKYSALYLVACWALFFLFSTPARVQLKKPGPYLALLVLALSTLPVLIWNSQHSWITLHHVADNSGFGSRWRPTVKYISESLEHFSEFVIVETALLNPVFFVGAVWAAVASWKRRHENPLWLYFFCLGVPVLLGHLLYSLHSRIQPNWIAPAVVPMFCLMVVYWDARWHEGLRWVKHWLTGGLVLGLVIVVPLHDSDLISVIAGHPLPGEMDPLRRARAWKETTAVVEQARQKLLQEGKPAFIIADHYGMTGLFSFYLPEAKKSLGGKPLVYCLPSKEPGNQLFFWPEFQYCGRRTSENAIYAIELDPHRLERDWPWRWLTGKPLRYVGDNPSPGLPAQLSEEFESVTALGDFEIKLGDRIFRRLRLFECRNLR